MRYYRYSPGENRPQSFNLVNAPDVHFLTGEVLLLSSEQEQDLSTHSGATFLSKEGILKAYEPINNSDPSRVDSYSPEDAKEIIEGLFDIGYLQSLLDDTYSVTIKSSIRRQIEKLRAINVRPYSELVHPSQKLTHATRLYRDIVKGGQDDLNLFWKRQFGLA